MKEVQERKQVKKVKEVKGVEEGREKGEALHPTLAALSGPHPMVLDPDLPPIATWRTWVEAEQEEDVREASISDALKALVDSTGHDAAQDLDTVNTRIGWVLGQELVRDERRSRNATSADF